MDVSTRFIRLVIVLSLAFSEPLAAWADGNSAACRSEQTAEWVIFRMQTLTLPLVDERRPFSLRGFLQAFHAVRRIRLATQASLLAAAGALSVLRGQALPQRATIPTLEQRIAEYLHVVTTHRGDVEGSLIQLRQIGNEEAARRLMVLFQDPTRSAEEAIAIVDSAVSIVGWLELPPEASADLLGLNGIARQIYLRDHIAIVGMSADELQTVSDLLRELPPHVYSHVSYIVELPRYRFLDEQHREATAYYEPGLRNRIVFVGPGGDDVRGNLVHELGHDLFEHLSTAEQQHLIGLFPAARTDFGRYISPYARAGSSADEGNMAALTSQAYAELTRVWVTHPETLFLLPGVARSLPLKEFIDSVVRQFVVADNKVPVVRVYRSLFSSLESRVTFRDVPIAHGSVDFGALMARINLSNPLPPNHLWTSIQMIENIKSTNRIVQRTGLLYFLNAAQMVLNWPFENSPALAQTYWDFLHLSLDALAQDSVATQAVITMMTDRELGPQAASLIQRMPAPDDIKDQVAVLKELFDHVNPLPRSVMFSGALHARYESVLRIVMAQPGYSDGTGQFVQNTIQSSYSGLSLGRVSRLLYLLDDPLVAEQLQFGPAPWLLWRYALDHASSESELMQDSTDLAIHALTLVPRRSSMLNLLRAQLERAPMPENLKQKRLQWIDAAVQREGAFKKPSIAGHHLERAA